MALCFTGGKTLTPTKTHGGKANLPVREKGTPKGPSSLRKGGGTPGSSMRCSSVYLRKEVAKKRNDSSRKKRLELITQQSRRENQSAVGASFWTQKAA